MEIVSGYQKKCKDRTAGLKSLWLLKFVPYSRSEVITQGNILLSIPETFVFQFYSLQNPNVVETMQQNEGGKYFETNISLLFSGSNVGEIELLQKLNTRMLTLDNNGIYKVYGLNNGLQGGTINYVTGGSKPDFNGFKIDLNGMEEKESFFIENPFDKGFINEGFNYYEDFIMYG